MLTNLYKEQKQYLFSIHDCSLNSSHGYSVEAISSSVLLREVVEYLYSKVERAGLQNNLLGMNLLIFSYSSESRTLQKQWPSNSQ